MKRVMMIIMHNTTRKSIKRIPTVAHYTFKNCQQEKQNIDQYMRRASKQMVVKNATHMSWQQI
jgi:hypothetical protein